MKKIFAFFVLSACLVAATIAVEYKLSTESDKYAGQDMDVLFANYCGNVERISSKVPYPNYQNDLVKKAVMKLNTVAPVSFYMYGGVISSYGFRKGKDDDFPWDQYNSILEDSRNAQFAMKKNWQTGKSTEDIEYLKRKFDYEYFSKTSRPPKSIEVGGEGIEVKGNTHAFLVYLCGEFRDRPTLIKEKLAWIDNMIKLPAVVQQKIDPQEVKDSGKSIWQYITAESYAYYVMFSREAFAAKESAEGYGTPSQYISISEKWSVDKPVPAFEVCEVKYMMTEYVSQPDKTKRSFPGYVTYMDGLAKYREQYCNEDDTNHYYDFRGDSNMKPNSPESNGMIWYATSMMNRCLRNAKTGEVSVAKNSRTGESLQFNVEQCKKYMSRPFGNRWNAARSALTTWVLRNQKFDPIFSNTRRLVTMIPGYKPEIFPMSFQTNGDEGQVYSGSDLVNYMVNFANDFVNSWLSPDAGFTSVFGVAPNDVKEIDYAYERLKDAVDRHTDWYASGYDDSYFEDSKARQIGQAYSPFVASSYEMSESDAFTAPGITVNGPVDGRRQWMFVFKVHRDKWYNTRSLAEGKKIDFETQWFDETSFGTTYLADTERAWDRLGTPLEGEMESILYLHNIMNEGTAIKEMGSPLEFPQISDDGLGATH